MTRNKVVLIPFPFDDLSTTKVRPAVCLTSPIGPHRHIVLAFITSRILSDPLDTDLIIPSNHPDFSSCGLRVSSTLRLHRLMTVTTSLIRRELGVLPPSLQAETGSRTYCSRGNKVRGGARSESDERSLRHFSMTHPCKGKRERQGQRTQRKPR